MLTSSDQVRDYWNKFSELYGGEIEIVSLPAGLALSRMLKIEGKNNILEVGCGSGELTLYWLRHLSDGCKYTSVDLSDDMLKMAAKKKEGIKDKLNNIDHSFVNLNAEDLNSIGNESIDIYIASLVLHLTPNPEKLLKEAYRVLKKGGQIGCTVLGKPDNSIFFKVVLDAFKNNGIQLPAKSSGGLSLVDRESIIKVLQDSGFEVQFCWKEWLTYDVFGEQGMHKLLGQPRIAKLLSEIDQEVKRKIENDVKQAILDLKERKIPLQAEIFYITATKAK